MLAGGLIATSLVNLAFGYTTAIVWWTVLWAINGALQVRPHRPRRRLRPAACAAGAASLP
jgi:sugar phosphate permease